MDKPKPDQWRRTLPRLEAWRLRVYAVLALRFPGWRRQALAEYGAGLEGSFPATPRPLTLFTACDEGYFWDYGLAFVFSIEALGAPQDVHLHLYRPSAQALAQLARLAEGLRTVRLTYTWDQRAAVDEFAFPAVYYATSRFVLAHFLLASTRSAVFCVDIDALVARPPLPELSTDAYDVGLILRANENHPRLKTMTGAFQLNATPGGVSLANAFARQMLAGLARRPKGHIDQAGLYFMYRVEQTIGQRVRWHELSKRFCDFKFEPDAIVWTAKGGQKNEEFYLGRKVGLLERYAALVMARPDPAAPAAPDPR